MTKITKISSQKRTGRYNIFLDNRFALGVSEQVLVDQDLHRGKELSDKEIKNLQNSEKTSKCLESAYRYLSYRPRSEYELRKKLLEKFPGETVEKTIIKLKKLHFIDDRSFSATWVESRGDNRGVRLLRLELKKKGNTERNN